MICVLCGEPLVLVGTVTPMWLHLATVAAERPAIARPTFVPLVAAS